ncbi:MAG: cobyric acid synthase [Caldilineaceae bacterium SB0662_bin_25]|nr:cobyric acid synthase [Caldilineaceae bacterium SB0662_bin_25]
MMLGTHSNAGKSLLATAFCRILARRGMRVAPFKAQNMSNNAGVTPEGGEMGRAQIVQAEAAGIYAHTDMNPVLLKPEGNRRSQVVLNGRIDGRIEAGNWLATKERLWGEVTAAYDRLSSRFDVVVLEGAGSPAEINLKAGDIVNLRMARHAGARCLLVGDIDRGGVFAALAGTMLLLEPEERLQIGGFLINRFRGDPALLGDGLEMLRGRAFGVPTLGVIPYVPDLRIADEDAVTLERDLSEAAALAVGQLDVAVIHLPRIANFDEFEALEAEPGVRLRYVERAEGLGCPAAVILPGTKATLSDLAWMRERGLDSAIEAAHGRGAQVVGICGGYQMAGEWLADPLGMEGEPGGLAAGLGLLPVATEFLAQKETHQALMRLDDGEAVRGYEIHTGESRVQDGAARFGVIVERSGGTVRVPDGAKSEDGSVWGSYLHGLFENDGFRHKWLRQLGWSGAVVATTALREREYDRLADAVEEAVDWGAVEALMG